MKDKKHKPKARWAVITSTVLLVLSSLIVLGMFNAPQKRDYAITNLLTEPSASALGGTIGVIIGANLLNIPSFFLGIYARRKKYKHGDTIIFFSSLLFIAVTIRLFMPTETSVYKGNRITEASNEFSIEFPCPTTQRDTYFGSIKSLMVEGSDSQTNVLFRAEFIPVANPEYVRNNFKQMLEEYAHISNIAQPEITISQSPLGDKGTYSGIKHIDSHEIVYHGVAYVGEKSMICTLISEPLSGFPAESGVRFNLSIEKKKMGEQGN